MTGKQVNSRRRFYWWNNWAGFACLVLLLVATPILTIILKLFDTPGTHWEYISSRLYSVYLSGTLLILLGVAVCTFIIGVGMAWLVSAYDFPGRKELEWLLILPLAFPSYMMAYAYVGILEYTGPVHSFIRELTGWQITGPLIDIMNTPGAVFIFSMSLFPYVYVVCRTSFISRSREVQEAAFLLGSSPLQTFFRIALPLARPAIAGGIALASMEVLNDYGTVKYFGLDTFTTGIFRAWFSFGDLNTGVRLAAMLTILVMVLIWLEHKSRGNRGWVTRSTSSSPPLRTQLKGTGLVLGGLAGLTALCISFIFPLAQLVYWVIQTAHKIINHDFWILVLRSFSLAAFTSALIVILATILLYALRLSTFSWIRYVTGIASLGYAIPGAVIAVGVMSPTIGLDKWLLKMNGGTGGLLLSSTVFMLIFAYCVRFMAVGYNAIDAGFQKTGKHVNEAARTLGRNSWNTLWKVDLPIVKNSIAAGLLLTFVDVIKELPLTLILRPFNFHTLATKAFDMATNEQVPEAANASLIVILTGVIPIILLNRIIRNKA